MVCHPLTSGKSAGRVQHVKAITIDLDDTLWAVGPVIVRAEQRLKEWYREHYPRIPEQFTRESAYELRVQVFEEHADRAYDLTFIRREVIRRMGEAAGYASIDVDAAFAVFDEARNDLELFPDVRPALQSLRARFRLVAVTNGNASLEKIGIDDLFDGFVSARSAGAAKPEPVIFDAAVEVGGAPRDRTLHIGDHPEMDVDGARRSGLHAVWVNRDGSAWPADLQEPDGVVNDLHELESLLGGGD